MRNERYHARDGRTHGQWKEGQYSVWAESAKDVSFTCSIFAWSVDLTLSSLLPFSRELGEIILDVICLCANICRCIRPGRLWLWCSILFTATFTNFTSNINILHILFKTGDYTSFNLSSNFLISVTFSWWDMLSQMCNSAWWLVISYKVDLICLERN